MEAFSNNTNVSFSQLFKKDGWFARLIFFQLILIPFNSLFFRMLRATKSPMDWVYFFVLVTFHLTIGFLLLKKRTQSTITVTISLLWILFVWKRALPFFTLALMLLADLNVKGVDNSIMSKKIPELIGVVVGVVVALALTIVWTRNLARLKREYV